MTFEFLIACAITPDDNIRRTLTGLLNEVLENHGNEFDEGFVADMIQIRYERLGEESSDADDVLNQHILIGFSVELPDETESQESVISDFSGELPNTSPIFHAVKFEDPFLQAELAERAKEIFALEMKLRRVLSIIYLHAYQDSDSFNLLRDEKINLQGSPEQGQMRAATENEFFHLLFSDYAGLNEKRRPTLQYVLDSIRSYEEYDTFRDEILSSPIEDEGDAEFLAELEALAGPIDQMRNCVAHNRRPSNRLTASYPNARLRLEDRLDKYLAQWEIQE